MKVMIPILATLRRNLPLLAGGLLYLWLFAFVLFS